MATLISSPGQTQAVHLESVETILVVDTSNQQFCIEFYKKIMVQIPTQITSWSFDTREERDRVYAKIKAQYFMECAPNSHAVGGFPNAESTSALGTSVRGTYTNERDQ
jgi:hypothetical protein